MKVFEKSSPLLIPICEFNTFEDYLNSLSKSCRYDLKKTLSKNNNLDYSKIYYDYEDCKFFMDLWSLVNKSSWGDWYKKRELDILDLSNILHCFRSDNAYHFVLKWGRYVYCNTPLYDKDVYKENELGKWMWLQFIKFCIENKWVDYIDLMGPSEFTTFGEVLNNRQHTNEKGDFGYKWKFIPRKIKNRIDKKYDDFKIYSDFSKNWKSVFPYSAPTKLLIIAHFDDEAIFFGNWLLKNGPETKVFCATFCPDRFEHFKKCMDIAGVKSYSYFNTPATLYPILEKEKLKETLKLIKNENEWSKIVTHNQYGEYSHLQHIEVHDLVKEIFPNEKIHVYYNSNTKQEYNEKEKLLNCYTNEGEQICINEIRSSDYLDSGSDWYKHTVGKNMIDYESIKKLFECKQYLKLIFCWSGCEKNHAGFDTILKIKKELEKRGHQIYLFDTDLNSSIWNTEADAFVVFKLEDAEICHMKQKKFFFFINEEFVMNNDEFSETSKMVDLSIKSFVSSHPIRACLYDENINVFSSCRKCDPLKIFWLPMFRDWYITIRKLEAHLWMGLVGENII